MIEAALFWICLIIAVLGLAALPLGLVMGSRRVLCFSLLIIGLLILSILGSPS